MHGLESRMRIRILKTVPLALVFAMSIPSPGAASPSAAPLQDDPVTRQMRVEMLRQVALFDTESLGSEGLVITTGGDRGQRIQVDLRTGATHATRVAAARCTKNTSGDPLCYSTDRVGHSYVRLAHNRRTRAALRLIGHSQATHTQGFTNQTELAAPFAWPTIEATAGPLIQVSDLRRSESADGTLTYTMQIHSCDGCGSESALLSIGPDRLVWRGGGYRVVIERGPQRIGFPPLDRVVPGRTFDSASDAVAARALARSTARRMSAAAQAEIDQHPEDPVGVIRNMVQTPNNAVGVKHRKVPRGAMLIARNRWLAVGWAVTWDSRTDSVRVTRRALQPLPAGPPPSRPVAPPVLTQTDATTRALAVEAGARVLAAAAWAVGQPGLRVESTVREGSGDDETAGVSTILMDFTNGVVATPGSGGDVREIRHPDWTECSRIGGDPKPGSATQRALSLAGKPAADYVCGPGGDTDLAWAGLFTPAGLALDWSVLWSASQIQKLVLDPDTVRLTYTTRWPGQPDKERKSTLAFSGPALTTFSKADSSGSIELRYEYGPQGLTFPRGEGRVNARALDAARVTLRAPSLLRRSARTVVRRAESSLARNPRSDPVATIRKAARDTAGRDTVWRAKHVRFVPREGGVLLHVTTRFGRSARAVTWNSRRAAVVSRAIGPTPGETTTNRR